MGTTCLTKVLMDRGSNLNILYANRAPFYRIVPGKEAMPLRRIWLNVTFGQPDNFHREPLTFEVVDFLGIYHALLGRPCFTKFMAVPNYTYLKLKTPGVKRVITIEGSYEQAYYYEKDCIAQIAALIAPCAPDGPGCNAERAPAEEATKTAAVLDRPSIDEVANTPGGGAVLAP
ncbi:uncharacterized protein [Miscanthus floridulus]|uniref:uncharacterized protein n=1 Tax=Miscanthus floridulus TaxID=154761 RepID=UPI00345AD3DC